MPVSFEHHCADPVEDGINQPDRSLCPDLARDLFPSLRLSAFLLLFLPLRYCFSTASLPHFLSLTAQEFLIRQTQLPRLASLLNQVGTLEQGCLQRLFTTPLFYLGVIAT